MVAELLLDDRDCVLGLFCFNLWPFFLQSSWNDTASANIINVSQILRLQQTQMANNMMFLFQVSTPGKDPLIAILEWRSIKLQL